MTQRTVDAISDHLTIYQTRGGYRFNQDALLLATDLPGGLSPSPLIYDLGAAMGPVALSVASRMPAARIVAVERQESLLALLRDNIAANALGQRVEVRAVDIREACALLPAHEAELVLCNPPYFVPGTHRMSEHGERAAARHELHGGLEDFVLAAFHVLRPGGWLKLVVPPARLPELVAAPKRKGDLQPTSLRFFHDRRDRDAYLVECVMRRGGAHQLTVRPPLIIHEADGRYTEEAHARILGAAVPDAVV
jgi:tRNA1Val (adenine37-N6)-methyltransferase